MNIKLQDAWYIRSDRLNVILCEDVAGREFPRGFYSTVGSAIEGFFEKKIRQSNATSINGLMSYLKTLRTACNKALSPLKIEVVRVKNATD